jgi:hypothetical protein
LKVGIVELGFVASLAEGQENCLEMIADIEILTVC